MVDGPLMSERLKLVAVLAAVFLTAGVGGMGGAWLARGAPVEKWGDVATWVAGVGTLLTAMVAVAPIFVEALRRRGVATALRRQLVMHLAGIAGTLAHTLDMARQQNAPPDARYPASGSPDDPGLRDDIAAVRQLFADAHLLDPKEFDILFSVVILLQTAERHAVMGTWTLPVITAAESLTREAYNACMRRERAQRLGASDAAPPAPPPRPPRAEPG